MRNYAYFTDRDVFGIVYILTNQDILSIMATKNIGLEFKTDTRFSYCNTNYDVGFNNRKITNFPIKMQCTKLFFDRWAKKHYVLTTR
jgi:hypothetical protein